MKLPKLSAALIAILPGLTATSLVYAANPDKNIYQPKTVAPTETISDSWWHGDRGLGDWLGLRTSLEDRGITFFGSYEANMGGNVSGGKKRGYAYADNFDFGFKFDLEKIAGWQGATLTVEAANRDGKSLTNEYVGNFYQTQQLYGVQTIMLYGLHLEQKLWDDKVSIKLGRFSMNEDFANSPIYGLYMGNAIDGNPKALVASNGFSSYPGSVWAARVKVATSEETSVSVGLYQANDRLYDANKHGLDFGIRSYDGATLVGQFAWNPTFAKNEEGKGLPGHYMVGAYNTFWDVPVYGTTDRSTGLYGFYVHGDQMVYQESPGSTQGLTLWSAAVVQPDEKVVNVPFQINVGAIYKGLLPSRDEDLTIVGFSYGKFGSDYARSVQQPGSSLAESESVIEAGYRFQVTKFAYVMPEVQYIIQPGGTKDLSNALVVGLRVGFTF